MSMREWRSDGHRPGLIVSVGVKDNDRVGHCWMKGRLLDGDLAMCLELSGDCFFRYCLLEHGSVRGGGEDDGRRLYKLIRGSEFSSYTTGTPYEYQPSAREFHLLMAGEMIPLDAEPRDPRRGAPP